jgi:hypothetical protein
VRKDGSGGEGMGERGIDHRSFSGFTDGPTLWRPAALSSCRPSSFYSLAGIAIKLSAES